MCSGSEGAVESKKDKPVRILVIEDSELQARVFVKLLRSLGYDDIAVCGKAEAAFDHLRAARIDVIFCDWELPEKSGFDLLKEVKAMPEFSSIPFIFLTGRSEAKLVVQAVVAGAQDYIVKPPAAETVREKIERVLKVTAEE